MLAAAAAAIAEGIAGNFVTEMLKASAAKLRCSFADRPVRAALDAAVSEALAAALAVAVHDVDADGQPTISTPLLAAHYDTLLRDFFGREAVVEELAQLLDPRPDARPGPQILARELQAVGWQPDLAGGFDAAAFAECFTAALWSAAGRQPALHGRIELRLLGQLVQQLGSVASHQERTAVAAERTAEGIVELKEMVAPYLSGKADERALRLAGQCVFPLASETSHRDLAGFLRGLSAPRATLSGAERSDASSRLPPPPARCFGREQVVEALVDAICSDRPRPSPVLGPPGIGKTTVTLAALHDPRVAAHFGDRRFFIRCDGILSREGMVAASGAALGLDADRDFESRLLAHLGSAPALLIFDNAETPYLQDPVEVEDLLARLAALHDLALVISIRSGVRPGGPAWREAICVEPLPIEEARRVFLDVAGERHRSDEYLDRLLAVMDGLPLAIHLLAHTAEAQPTLELLWRRWDQERFDILHRPGDQTRDTNVEVSIALSLKRPDLDASSRRLLSLISLVPDGLLEQTLSDILPGNMLRAAATLRDAGFVAPGSPRLRLLAPVREVLLRRLPATEEDRDFLKGHYIALAGVGDEIGLASGAKTIQHLMPELRNFEALMTDLLARATGGRAEQAIQATLQLRKLVSFTGYGASALFASALAAARRIGTMDLEAHCLKAIGNIDFYQGEFARAQENLEQALALFKARPGDLLDVANCLEILGDIAYWGNRLDDADALFCEALLLYTEVENKNGQANCTQGLGEVAWMRGQSEAETLYLRALQLFSETGSLLGRANSLQCLGDVASVPARLGEARTRYEEAIRLYKEVGSIVGEAHCSRKLGVILHRLGDDQGARGFLWSSILLFRKNGSLASAASGLLSLGDLALSESDVPKATNAYKNAIALYERIGNTACMDSTSRRLAKLTNPDLIVQLHDPDHPLGDEPLSKPLPVASVESTVTPFDDSTYGGPCHKPDKSI